MKLNIGCGTDLKKDYINIDILDFGQEKILDITKGLPYKDKEIEEIYCSHTLEHIDDIKSVIEEFKRVAKKITIIVPHRCHTWANCVGHIRLFDEEYFNKYFPEFKLETRMYKCNEYGWGIELIAIT
jgi:ubiquinone/menaquinone biosynthesis C-methylase UbiE